MMKCFHYMTPWKVFLVIRSSFIRNSFFHRHARFYVVDSQLTAPQKWLILFPYLAYKKHNSMLCFFHECTMQEQRYTGKSLSTSYRYINDYMYIIFTLFGLICCLFSKCSKNSTTNSRPLYITYYLRRKWIPVLIVINTRDMRKPH